MRDQEKELEIYIEKERIAQDGEILGADEAFSGIGAAQEKSLR